MTLFIFLNFFLFLNSYWCLMLFFFFFIFFSVSHKFFNGLMFYFDNDLMIVLSLMSVVILGLIFFCENNNLLKNLSLFLVFVSLLFFFSSNIFYLYLFFEFSLFPIMVMILSFGYQIEKINSSYYLFFYTLFCSMPFFIFLMNLENLLIFYDLNFLFSIEMVLIVFMMFMLKFPVYFFHLWLPKAHVEAPTTASMLLAGLLLKFGTGGFLRMILMLNFFFIGVFFILSFIGMIISSYVCLTQSDLKSLAAFSSINHMSLVLLVLVFLSNLSIWSSLIIMLSHGFISTLMFFFIGEFYHFNNNRLIYYYSGGFMSSFFMLMIISLTWLYNSGIPFSVTFLAEFKSFMVLFNFNIYFLFLGFLYFFLTFYYCLFFISLNFMNFNNLNINMIGSVVGVSFIFLNSNYFIFNLMV